MITEDGLKVSIGTVGDGYEDFSKEHLIHVARMWRKHSYELLDELKEFKDKLR